MLLSVFAVKADEYTLFHGGEIITMAASAPQPEAMLIKGAEIVATGSMQALLKITSDVKLYDLKGNTIIPGFIDSHVHVRELGADAIKADLVGAETVAEMVKRLKAFYPKPIAGQWLLGQGWDEGFFGTIGYPDRALLDDAFPDNPIKLESLHGFGGFYNGKALEIAGVTKDTPEPEVGQIMRRANGVATGTMLTLAQDLVNIHVPALTLAQRETSIIKGLKLMAAAGVTSIHEAGMTELDVQAFMNLRARNALPIRVYGMLNGNDNALMSTWYAKGYLDDPTDWLDIRGVKVFYDGSLGSRTAMLREPYSDKPNDAHPTERITPAKIMELAKDAAKNGFQMAVHAIGDEGNDRTLGIYEQALSSANFVDHRWRIEHAQLVLKDYYERVSKLNIISSMQSSHAVGDSKWAEDRVGNLRIHHAYARQNILKSGGKLIINSDLPGEPWTPIETLYFAVNRMSLNGIPINGWYMEQALSVNEALNAMTIAGAHAAYQDKTLGSLISGKWADFVILDKNPYKVDHKNLKNIKVEETWVAGRQVK